MGMGIQYGCIPSLKLTVRHGKSTILMVFTRKHGDFHGLLLLVSGRVYIYMPVSVCLQASQFGMGGHKDS